LDYLTEAEPLRERPPHQPSIPARAPLPPPRVDPHYFPLALPRMFGYLTVPPRELLTTYTDQPEMESAGVTKKGKRKVKSFAFPENLRFETADWPNDEGFTWDKAGYDVIIG
jgi:7SK snRNA methylphosphate capping enzyme